MPAEAEDQLLRMQFVDDRERQMFAEASLGIEAQEFLRSPVGAYLHGCAKQEYESAKEELLHLAPARWGWQSKRVQLKALKLQMRAENAHNFMQWMAEAIQQGALAEQSLEQDEIEGAGR
jgi:hypothetical protein